MANFFWAFKGLKAFSDKKLGDVIVSVGYRLFCEQDGSIVFRDGRIAMAPADPEHFTPYGKVTKKTMATFAEQALAADLDSIKQAMLSELSEPPIDIRPMPWESAEETEQ